MYVKNLLNRFKFFIFQLFEIILSSFKDWKITTLVILLIITIVFTILGKYFFFISTISIILISYIIFFAFFHLRSLDEVIQKWQFRRFLIFLTLKIFLVIIAFSSIYYILSYLNVGLENRLCYNKVLYSHCLYYSLVIATTTGVGDFVPVHIFSRITTMIQLIFGPVFLIAYLGFYIQYKKKSRVKENSQN